MQRNLPVQTEGVDRSQPYEQYLVPRVFHEPDGSEEVLNQQPPNGYYGHDVGDPSPLVCRDPGGEECRIVLNPARGGPL